MATPWCSPPARWNWVCSDVASVASRIRDWPESGERLAPLLGQFLAVWDADPGSREWVYPGAGVRSARASDLAGGDVEAVAMVRLRGMAAPDEAETGEPDRVRLTPTPMPQARLAGSDTPTDVADGVRLSGRWALRLRDVATDDGERVWLGARVLPTLREPGPGEMPGTINLVENPSLEESLSGWSATAGITLSRDDGDAWAGRWAAKLVVDAGAGSPVASVAGAGALGLSDETPWIGSVWAAGELGTVTVGLRFAYAAGADDDGDTHLTDPDGDPDEDPLVPGPEWSRLTTLPTWPTAGRIVERVTLRIVVGQSGAAQTLWLDGAQLERAPWGGATPYVDGDQGAGCRWDGAPHGSLSVREPQP